MSKFIELTKSGDTYKTIISTRHIVKIEPNNHGVLITLSTGDLFDTKESYLDLLSILRIDKQ